MKSKIIVEFHNLVIVCDPTTKERPTGLHSQFIAKISDPRATTGNLISVDAWGDVAEKVRNMKKGDVINGSMDVAPWNKRDGSVDVGYKLKRVEKSDRDTKKTTLRCSFFNLVTNIQRPEKKVSKIGQSYTTLSTHMSGNSCKFLVRGIEDEGVKMMNMGLDFGNDSLSGVGKYFPWKPDKTQYYIIDIEFVTYGKRVCDDKTAVDDNAAQNEFKEGIPVGKSFG